jgi:hypothetical protein
MNRAQIELQAHLSDATNLKAGNADRPAVRSQPPSSMNRTRLAEPSQESAR